VLNTASESGNSQSFANSGASVPSQPASLASPSSQIDILSSLDVVPQAPYSSDLFSNLTVQSVNSPSNRNIQVNSPSSQSPADIFANLTVQVSNPAPFSSDMFASQPVQPLRTINFPTFSADSQYASFLPVSAFPSDTSVVLPAGKQVCAECEMAPAVVVCGDCAGSVYCLSCSTFVHSTAKILRSHLPTPVPFENSTSSNIPISSNTSFFQPSVTSVIGFDSSTTQQSTYKSSDPFEFIDRPDSPKTATQPAQTETQSAQTADPFSHLF
jgi:hypothetical protein